MVHFPVRKHRGPFGHQCHVSGQGAIATVHPIWLLREGEMVPSGVKKNHRKNDKNEDIRWLEWLRHNWIIIMRMNNKNGYYLMMILNHQQNAEKPSKNHLNHEDMLFCLFFWILTHDFCWWSQRCWYMLVDIFILRLFDQKNWWQQGWSFQLLIFKRRWRSTDTYIFEGTQIVKPMMKFLKFTPSTYLGRL